MSRENLDKCSDEELQFYYSVLKPCVNLEKIVPQYIVKISETRRRVIDFALIGDGYKIALELDGKTYHAPGHLSEEKWEDGLRRDNELQLLGWTVLHFSYRQVNEEIPECRQYVKKAIENYPELRRVPFSRYTRKPQKGNVVLIRKNDSPETTPADQSLSGYVVGCVDMPSRMRIEMSGNDKVKPPKEVIFFNHWPGDHKYPFGKNYWMKPVCDTTLYVGKNTSCPIVATLEKGEVVKLITADFHTFPPNNKLEVLRPLSLVNSCWKKGDPPLVGDNLYLLSSVGENRFLAWCNGDVITVWGGGICGGHFDIIPNSNSAENIWAKYHGSDLPSADLWLKVRTVDKIEGWILYYYKNWMKNKYDVFFTEKDIDTEIGRVLGTCTSMNVTYVSSPEPLKETDFILAGIKMGDPPSKVQELLGPPMKMRDIEGTNGKWYVYEYGTWIKVFFIRDRVGRISIIHKHAGIETRRKISIGMMRDNVIKAYGTGTHLQGETKSIMRYHVTGTDYALEFLFREHGDEIVGIQVQKSTEGVW